MRILTGASRYTNGFPELREKLVFLIVGALSASCYIVLATALHYVGLSPTASSAFAYIVCLPLGYLGHRSFTFRSKRRHLYAGIAYPAVQVVALLIAVGITFVAAVIFAMPPVAAFFLAAICAAAASYFMQKHWVF
jgi:putative flippase GtrA